jgi:CRISPR-associated protein Cmr3
MQKIISGQLPQLCECHYMDELFCLEQRIGIQRDKKTLTTGEMAMYSPHYVRLQKDISLAIAVDNLPADWTLPLMFPLGGESRMTICTPLKSTLRLPAMELRTKKVVVIALTPTYFIGGPWWGAGPGDSASFLNSELQGTLVTSAMDRPVLVGGWDTCQGASLPMYPMAPPGSVWWIENTAFNIPPDRPLKLGDRTAFGFGMALVGVWPE